jgi:hypothetical protein
MSAQPTISVFATVPSTIYGLVTSGSLASPNAAGVVIVSSGSGKRVKVYGAEFYPPSPVSYMCLYFGTAVAPTTKRFLGITGSVTAIPRASYANPIISDVGDALFMYSSGSQPNVPYSISFVLE